MTTLRQPDDCKPNDRCLCFGLFADVHHADLDVRNNRYHRQALERMRRAVADFELAKVDFAVELGDLIDEAPTAEAELALLHEANAVFSHLPAQRHYVLGNHCVWSLTKQDFLEAIGRHASYYSFEQAGWRFLVLDACFRSDGQPYGLKNHDWRDSRIPDAELEWLAYQLGVSRLPTIVFVHQRLDVSSQFGVGNAPEVRRLLESSGCVVAVFQGHEHTGGYCCIAGIHYVTLVSVVEEPDPLGGAHAVVHLTPQAIKIQGYGRQSSLEFPLAANPAARNRSPESGTRTLEEDP